MRLRRALVAPLVPLALLAAAPASPGGNASSEPKVSIARSGKGGHEASVRFEAGSDVRVRLDLRLVGRPIEAKPRVIDEESVAEDFAAGRVRLDHPFRGAAASCFAFERCELRGTATVIPLTAPTPPATEPTPGGPASEAKAKRRVDTGRPEIDRHHIPYGKDRRRQMAAYSERHYGEREWRLIDPRGIVEHYTASSTAEPALNTFEQNRPDVEYGELPGVCAHYLIDTDGMILELVPTDIRCRHTVGLNHATIGIEHVGRSDSDVVGRPQVLRASLALTSWLRCAYAIKRSNVIGHNESLGSPLYHELDPDFRGRTHGDMRPGTMRGYRTRLEGC